MYLDRTFARRIGSAKVKSESEVAHFTSTTYSHYIKNYYLQQYRLLLFIQTPEMCLKLNIIYFK